MKRLLAVLMTMMMVIALSACAATPKVTLGEIEEGVYSNEFFGLNMDVPEDWTVLSQEELIELMGMSSDMIAETNPDMADAYDLENMDMLQLFGFFKYPMDELRIVNPNILGTAEKVGILSGVSNGKEYLEFTSEQLLSMGFGYEISEDIEEVEVFGKTLSKMQAILDMGDEALIQDFYCTVENGYALVIIATYSESDGQEEIANLLK